MTPVPRAESRGAALGLLLLAACSAPPPAPDAGCLPPPDRACSSASDCALLNHQVDCCGSEVALGLASGARAAAEQQERVCAAQWPRCKCVAQQTVADDGKPFADAAGVKVRCVAGRCESYGSP